MITGNSQQVNIKGKDDFNVGNVVAFLVEINYMESLKGLHLSDGDGMCHRLTRRETIKAEAGATTFRCTARSSDKASRACV